MIEQIKLHLKDLNIIKFYDLVNYDSDMHKLYDDLSAYIDSRFKDRKIDFKDNDRIIFFLSDHEFFISDNFPGFTTYNLQIILRELDIPTYFCRLITAVPNYKKYTSMARDLLNPLDKPIPVVTSLYSRIDDQYPDTNLNPQCVKKLFSIGSRLRRTHRTYFMAQLFSKNLQDFGYINYYNIPASADVTDQSVSKIKNRNNNCYFLTSDPFGRQNTEIPIKNPKNVSIMKNFQESVPNYSNVDSLKFIDNKKTSVGYQWIELQNSLIYVGLASVATNYPEAYQDEISFKSIAVKRPFILFGVPGLLSHLKSLGFKTFGNFWDESYDKIFDFEQRVESITKILESLSSKTEIELQNILQDMADILEHNFNHLKNVLPKKELHNLIEGIR